MRTIVTLLCCYFISTNMFATTNKYRCIIRDDPSTTMTIGWNQVNGSTPVVYYDVVDYGTNTASYAFSNGVDRTTTRKGMNNNFSRLTNLLPNTIYYFVIADNNSTSTRFSFRTSPNVPTERLSFIAGGDSRNNRTARQNANRIVAKTRPNAVMFGGDMTNGDSNGEWRDWFDDWQLTTSIDGRMTPIIATRGNHESANTSISELFDTPNSDVYYAINFGGNLYRAYTLNTLISVSGTQKNWLQNDLQAHQNVRWKSAQYHHPMRPHVASKSERNDMVTHWAPLFETLGINYVVECDAHTVKTTYPIRTSTASGSDEGFIRDDANGVVYMGEGCWGAPLRPNNDSKSWTRASGSFNQVKWIFISLDTVEVRTIRTNNANTVGALTDANRFTMPTNIDIWTPAPGEDVVYIVKKTGVPEVTLYNPLDGQLFMSVQPILLEAVASDTDGVITNVEFYVDGMLVGSDNTMPYKFSWTPSSSGQYVIAAKATDNDGKTTISNSATIDIFGNTITTTSSVTQSSDDAEERTNGNLSLTSSDLEMVNDNGTGNLNQVIGIRFSAVNVPLGAVVTNAYIQFTCDETASTATNLTIKVEDVDQPNTFVNTSNNITNRTTFGNVPWNSVPNWNSTGAATTNERTSDLTSLVQHIVNRGGWQQGNAMAFIIDGTGKRVAESFDGTAPAQLIVEYQSNGQQIGTIDVQINGSSDDAEERSNGTMYLNSSDLELVFDGSNQNVGMRFTNITIPQGATITSSYLQFTVDEISSGTTNLDIFMQNDVNPTTFTSTTNNISTRPTLANSIVWNPSTWNTVGMAGIAQRTPDLTTLIQAMVNNGAWNSGNAMAFIIRGTGERVAESYNGVSNAAPRLIINYSFTIPSAIKLALARSTLCPGSSVTLNGGSSYARYYWNDQITLGQQQQLQVNSAGSYVLRVMDEFGQVTSDTAIVTTHTVPTPDLGPDQNLNGGSVTFTMGTAYSNYLWSTGETTAALTTNVGGVYTVTVTDMNGCTATDIAMAITNVLSINENVWSFQATLLDNQALLNWEVEEDYKSDYFILERSMNAIDFEEIARIEDDLLGEYKYYTFVDKTPLLGIGYYRLKQVYTDNKYLYSDIKAINYQNKIENWARFYPNPAQDYIRLEVDLPVVDFPVSIEIYNQLGEFVRKESCRNTNIEMNLSTLNSGAYVLRITTARKTTLTKHLIIQK